MEIFIGINTVKKSFNNKNNLTFFCSRGQLGHGTLEDESEPVLIEALAGLKINTIRAGGWHSCALSADGDLYTWGWNGNGQLGLENSTKDKPVTVQATPQIVESFSTEMNVKMVALGNRHTLAMLGLLVYHKII